MAVEGVGLTERDAGRLPGMEAILSTGLCDLGILARTLAILLGRAVSPGQVQDKAVGLGLLRYPGEADPPPPLSCQTASRLLLAGYRLPALVEPGTLRPLREHLRQGRQVLVPLHDEEHPGTAAANDEPSLFQLHCYHPDAGDGPRLSLGKPHAPVAAVQQWPLDRFVEAWAAADGLLFVAARAWGELPREGETFLGGARDPDGTYHWDVAGYITDRDGNILRG